MSDEKRVERFDPYLSKEGGTAPVALMGGFSDGKWIRYSDYEAAESKLAEVEGERDESDSAGLNAVAEAEREHDRADKAEADLARAMHALGTVAKSHLDEWDAKDCRQFAQQFLRLSPAQEQPPTADDVFGSLHGAAGVSRPIDQEQPRYTVAEIRERLRSRSVLGCAAAGAFKDRHPLRTVAKAGQR
jgi:hypothetical protein